MLLRWDAVVCRLDLLSVFSFAADPWEAEGVSPRLRGMGRPRSHVNPPGARGFPVTSRGCCCVRVQRVHSGSQPCQEQGVCNPRGSTPDNARQGYHGAELCLRPSGCRRSWWKIAFFLTHWCIGYWFQFSGRSLRQTSSNLNWEFAGRNQVLYSGPVTIWGQCLLDLDLLSW